MSVVCVCVCVCVRERAPSAGTSEDAAKTTGNFLCIVQIKNYCNSLLMGTPNSIIQPTQKVQNTAARLILRVSRHQNCTPLLQQLHWLPISERIKYKTACMCYNAITGSAPSYLSELLHLYSPSSSLRSSSDTRMLKIQRFNRKTIWLSHFLTFWPPHLEQSPPRHQALCYSLFLQKSTQDISLLRIFQLNHIVLHSHQSVQCVCVCVCVCVRACVRACLPACLPACLRARVRVCVCVCV